MSPFILGNWPSVPIRTEQQTQRRLRQVLKGKLIDVSGLRIAEFATLQLAGIAGSNSAEVVDVRLLCCVGSAFCEIWTLVQRSPTGCVCVWSRNIKKRWRGNDLGCCDKGNESRTNCP